MFALSENVKSLSSNAYFLTLKGQCSYHIETSQSICKTNVIAALASDGLIHYTISNTKKVTNLSLIWVFVVQSRIHNHRQTFKMELFAKVVNDFQTLTISAKCFILDVR